MTWPSSVAGPPERPPRSVPLRLGPAFGVAEQLLAELRAIGGVIEKVRFRGVAALHDPEAVKRCLDIVAKRAGVDVFFHSTITDATRDGGRLVSAAEGLLPKPLSRRT